MTVFFQLILLFLAVPHDMWVPHQGLNSCLLLWEHAVLTTGLPGIPIGMIVTVEGFWSEISTSENSLLELWLSRTLKVRRRLDLFPSPPPHFFILT